MVHTYTLAYLRTRSLPELFALRSALHQRLAALPRHAADRVEILEALERIRWLLAARAPGFSPR